MKVLKDVAELDGMLAACNEAEAVSDDALRALFATFRMDPPPAPDDPFSAEYRDAQMALYARIAGRPYSTANEVTAFDVDAAVAAPFPFSTRSCATAGEHFQAMGMLLRQMALKPGSRVLEFGPGWGNTTIALAKLGHRVTAVYIDLEQLAAKVEANPKAFGLASAGACPRACLTNMALADKYLFHVDRVHLSSAGFAIIGRYAVDQLQAASASAPGRS